MNDGFDTLSLGQQRALCDVCWKFEQDLASGKVKALEAYAEMATELPRDVVLAELSEIQRERQGQEPTPRAVGPIDDERYEVIEEIARGGTAVVWRVRDRHLQRQTALKCLLDSQDNERMRARLQQEARLCARLVHPGIVPIHEQSRFADGRPFVSMKLVEGKTLQQLLDMSPRIPIKRAVEVFERVCEAMAYAHSQAIIHRDLKPSNIMVGAFGEVQVMDWGWGKDLRDGADDVSVESISEAAATTNAFRGDDTIQSEVVGSTRANLTIHGNIFGTIAYMSPEQARGKTANVGKPSDVFALGGILCRILTGASPYRAPSERELLKRAQAGDLDDAINRLHACGHRALAELAIRCMSPDRSERPADAQGILDELARIRRVQRRWKVAGIGAGMVALFGLSSAVMARRPPASPAIATVSGLEKPVEEAVLDPGAIALLVQNQRYDRALSAYQEVFARHPTDRQVRLDVYTALMNLERFTEAEKVARDLLALGPDNPTAHGVLSDTLLWLGRLEEAKASLQESLRHIEPRTEGRRNAEERLAYVERLIDIQQAIGEQPAEELLSLPREQLREVAKVADITENYAFAIACFEASFDRAPNVDYATSLRSEAIVRFCRKNLFHREVTTEDRNRLCWAVAQWAIPVLDFLDASTRDPGSQHPFAPRLKYYMKEQHEYDFIEPLVTDSRLEEPLRKSLSQIWLRVEPYAR